MTIEDLLNYILSFLENTKNEEKELKEELRIKELEQQDLLHELEISKLNASELAKVTKHLVKVRKERRILKNILSNLKLARRFTDRWMEKNLNGEIKMLQHEIKKLNRIQKYCKYQPRILKDLKCGGMK